MTYEDAMNQMKLGRAAKRAGWAGHTRIEGLTIIRVTPGRVPYLFYASREDKAATDWVASVPPTRSDVQPNIATFSELLTTGRKEPGGVVDEALHHG